MANVKGRKKQAVQKGPTETKAAARAAMPPTVDLRESEDEGLPKAAAAVIAKLPLTAQPLKKRRLDQMFKQLDVETMFAPPSASTACGVLRFRLFEVCGTDPTTNTVGWGNAQNCQGAYTCTL